MADDDTPLRSTSDGTPALPLLTEEQWAERQPGRRRGQRRRGGRPLLVRMGHRAALLGAAATIGISAAVMVVHASNEQRPEQVAPVTAPAEAVSRQIPAEPGAVQVKLAAQTVLPGSSFAPLAVRSVRARPGRTSLTLIATTTRRTELSVTLGQAGTDLRARTVAIKERGVHRIRFAGLPGGSLTWRVRAPGESARAGDVRILPAAPPAVPPPTPPAPPVPAAPPVLTAPPPSPEQPATKPPRPSPPATTQGTGKPKEPKGTGGTGGGPSGPRDPDVDGPSGPIDPDDT